jgi:hypothetical protein
MSAISATGNPTGFFVDIPFTTDDSTLADDAVADWATNYPGYVPEDEDPEVILIESCAPMAANAAQQASQMPIGALVAYGQKVLGIPYSAGAPALAVVTFTAVDAQGYTIDSGAEVEIDGYAFDLIANLTIPTGQTTATGIVACTLLTAAANDLPGSICAPVSCPSYIVGVAVTGGNTGNGEDPDDDVTYANTVSLQLRLRGLTLVSVMDFILASLLVPGVARSSAIGNTARQITWCGVDINGAALGATVKAAVVALFSTDRLVNTTFTVVDSTDTTVNVEYNVLAAAGQDPTDLISRCNTALEGYLNPVTYGQPVGGDPTNTGLWQNTPTLSPNVLIGLLSSVVGVRQVNTLSISAAGIANNANGSLTLAGQFPLPLCGTLSGTATPST